MTAIAYSTLKQGTIRFADERGDVWDVRLGGDGLPEIRQLARGLSGGDAVRKCDEPRDTFTGV